MVVQLTPESVTLLADEIYKRMKSSDDDDILNISELAKLLKVEESWVYKKVASLPHFRVGKHIRFHKKEVLAKLKSPKSGD